MEDEPLPVMEENTTPLRILVEKGTKFYKDQMKISHMSVYPMSLHPRGHALIISNQEFDDPQMFPFRKGAQVDADNMEQLFTQLGFVVVPHKNLKRNETLEILIEFKERAGNKPVNMMIVCVLSHGLEHGKIVSSDGLLIDTEKDIFR